MDYSVQNIHRLPVLKFDSSSNDKAAKFGENYAIHTTQNFAQPTILKENRSRKKRTTDVVRKLSNTKIKTTEHKYKLRRKSANLINIKKNLSTCSNYIKRIVKSPKTLQYTKNKKQRNTSMRSNEIKVLFSSDISKNNKRRKTNQSLINDIYDLEERCLCNNFDEECNQPLNMVNMFQEVPKNTKQRKSLALNDVKCTNLRYSSSIPSCGCTLPTHYKVIDFPNYDVMDAELEEINIKGRRRSNLNNCQCQTENENLKVTVTTSNTRRGGGDCPTVSNQCDLKEVCIKSVQHENESKSNQDCCNTFKTVYNPIMLHENAIYLAKGALKFIIFALALIVWSPCIVALFFCWVVTYPLRPKQIHRTSRCKSKPVVKIHVHGSKRTVDNSIQTCPDNNLWSPLVRGINWALNSIALSFGVFKSLLHSGNNDSARRELHYPPKGRYRNKTNKRCVMTSNPKNKYTLYYSKNKGWVMKAAERKRRDNSSQCRKKCVRTVASEPYCGKFCSNNTIGVNTNKLPRCARRSQSYPGKPTVCKSQQKVVPSVRCSCHHRHRHRHLCTNTRGLPVHFNFSSPIRNKANLKRHAYSKDLLHQTWKPIQSQERIFNSLTKQGTPITFRHKVYRYCKNTVSNINRLIGDVEKEVWRYDIRLGDAYVYTLRKKPCFFVYKICPSLYPFFLTTYRLYKNLCHFLLLIISACIWCPLLGFCYMCYAAFCRAL